MAEASTSAAPAPKIRHDWYQTDNEVIVNVFIKNVKEEDLKVDVQPRSASVNVKHPTGSEIVVDFDPFTREIDPSKSSHKALSSKIEIKLAKKQPGIKWEKLEGDDSAGVSMSTSTAPTSGHRPTYPSSSRTKHNFDLIARTAEEEEAEEEKRHASDPNAGGDKALQQLFQKLYADADDDQKKAMLKSYQESNGTALSTDWGEVSKKPVEVKPPDSMVAKKWDS